MSVDSGIGFFGLLIILFIGLKLTGHIGWSWFWVLSPITIPICTILLIIVSIFVYWILKELLGF